MKPGSSKLALPSLRLRFAGLTGLVGRNAKADQVESTSGEEHLFAAGAPRTAYNPGRMWKPGDRLTHRLNPALGPGRVTAVAGRSLTVQFPDSGETLTLAAGDGALVPLILAPGARARLETTGETVVVACHGGVVNASLVAFLGLDHDGTRLDLRTRNTSITEWEREDGKWRLLRYNDSAHLATVAVDVRADAVRPHAERP